jgi:hypothetical protein
LVIYSQTKKLDLLILPYTNRRPQGSDLAPDLFNIFTSDIPKVAKTITATYADDTVIISSNKDPILASSALQTHIDQNKT